MCVKLSIFSCTHVAVLAYVLGAKKNRLSETVLLSTNNIHLNREIRKLYFNYALLSIGLST